MKLIFEYLTGEIFLFENPVENYIVIALVGYVAFEIAFHAVGKLYGCGIINGSEEGSFFHWFIRIVFLVIIYYLIATVVKLYNWFNNLPITKWWVIGGAVGGFVFLYGLVKIIKYKKRERKRNTEKSEVKK